ncbi:MAG: hypothetical protein AAFV87_16965 [Pseudomonadota bacterium]
MYTLVFSVLWTALMAIGVFFISSEVEYQQQEQLFKVVFTLTPFAGLLFIWDSVRKLRRYRSVRFESLDNETVYIWTELNGTEKRSTVDPRVQWDIDDRNFADP